MKRLAILTVVLLWLGGMLPAAGVAAAADEGAITAEQLATAVATANPGDTLVVQGGTFHGTLTIDKPLTLVGREWPVIDGGGKGTVVNINAPDTTIQGFVIRNSGSSLDAENSGIAGRAPRLTIAGNRFEDTLFGIYLQKASNSLIRDNFIASKTLDVPRRGDGIRVWSSNDVLVENNVVHDGRDVVLWYSERLTLRGNVVRNGRYGLHFMYCDDAVIEQNQLLNNSVGAFLMYSRRLHMHQNTVAFNRGPSGYGIGLKDVDDAMITENKFLDNRVGAYLDGSPREVDSIGHFEGNLFAYNDIGVELMPAVRHNQFFNNSFVENEEQMAIAGGGTPGDNAWTVEGRGNYWSDYAGFDADQDGVGDLAYRSERLFENLMQREPGLRLFLFSPAAGLLDFAARAFPLVKPQPKLVDERPWTHPIVPADTPAPPQPENQPWGWAAVLLVAAALLVALLAPRLQQRRYRFPAQGRNPS